MGCRPIPVFPLFCQLQAKSCTPPTLHDLEGASQMDKGWTPRLSNGQGFDPPNPSRLVPNGQGFDPPNPSRLGAAPQMDKGLNPQPFTTLEQLPNGQGFGPPNPSRLGGVLKWTRV